MMSPRECYNRVAQAPPDTHHLSHLRRRHNALKADLIHRALLDAHSSLECACIADFACGRGGDLNKVSGCRRYWGVDVADRALGELQRRAAEIQLSDYTVLCRDAGTPGTVPGFTCDLALCNFALHYFCDTEEHCKALLTNVAACLRVGGTFVGIYLEYFSNDACHAFGRGYRAKIGDCVDAVEYRVPFGRVVGLAYAVGLYLARTDPGAPACHCGCMTFGFVRATNIEENVPAGL